MKAWSTAYPGFVWPQCGDPTGELEVHHDTGRSLRIGGDIHLCFECGPDGGVYHPDQSEMATIRKGSRNTRSAVQQVRSALP